MAHTPGPWHAILQEPHGDFEIRDCERDQEGRLVGQAFWQSDKTEANARLIAAAPDLLEALEILTAERERQLNERIAGATNAYGEMPHRIDKDAVRIMKEQVEQARAAIAKAKE